jgi:hypothetical protein
MNPAPFTSNSIEALETRIAPAAILITGTAGDDSLTIIATSADAGTYQLNDGPVVPFSGVTSFEFHGGDGDDTLTIVNPDGSVFAPAAGIVYAGEAHRTSAGDKLVLIGGGGSAFTETWTLGATTDAGTFNMSDGTTTQTIQYSGLEPIVDTGAAASLMINGNSNANIINYVASTTAGRGLIGVDSFETTEFANKGTLIINGGGGADTIYISNPGTPTGLTGITVNGGDPGDGDTLVCTGAVAMLDNLRHNPTGLGAGTVVNDSAPQPAVTYTGISKVRLIVQQNEGDGVRVEGTTGNDRFEFWHGATMDSGVFRGTMDENNATGNGPFPLTETEYFGIANGNDVDFNFFVPGGTDTFVFNGTANNDALNASTGEAGGLEVSDTINGVKVSRIEVFNVASVLIHGGGATDTLNFTNKVAATTLDLGTATVGYGAVTVAFADIDQMTINGFGLGSSLTVNGTAADDTFNVALGGVGAGSFTVAGAGVTLVKDTTFIYSGVPAFTVDGGTGFDVLGVAQNGSFTSTSSSITRVGGGTVTTSNIEKLLVETGTFGFTTPTAYDVGKTPKGVAFANLNGDAYADLVVVNSGTGTVSVLLGTASGRYQDPVEFSTGGKKPNSVAVGDFNGDAKLDLAVANGGSKTIGILLGDGGGAFAAATTVSSGKGAADIHTADLDNNTKLDLVFLAGTNVGTLTGAGDGTFASLATIATGGKKPVALAIGDFNQDTFVDIATANNGSKNVSLLTGTGTGFNEAVKFAVGTKPSAIVAGDFDRDGKLDLAVTNAGNRFISLLLGNGNAAGSQFDRQINIAAPGLTAPSALAVADVNRDGIIDLVASNSTTGSLAILLGLGTGLFTTPIPLSLGGDPKMKPGAIAIGDANGDGALDIAVIGTGSGDVSVALAVTT